MTQWPHVFITRLQSLKMQSQYFNCVNDADKLLSGLYLLCNQSASTVWGGASIISTCIFSATLRAISPNLIGFHLQKPSS